MIEQPKQEGLKDIKHTDSLSAHILARPFLQLCIAQHLLTQINPNSTWWVRLKSLLDDFPSQTEQVVTLNAMGIIEGYTEWDWQ